ncbi:unnamed protein product, partial [Ectocarpus fasciculatus]
KARWWCSLGARCEDSSGLQFHRHPFGNDLKKCRDFVRETGMELCLVHASREEADNETRRVLHAKKKAKRLLAAMARGGEEARAGAGSAAASEVAAASTAIAAASTDVAAAAAAPAAGVGGAAATTGSLGAGEGEGGGKDSSDDDSDGRDKDRARGSRDGTAGPGQGGSAVSPGNSTKNRGERCSHALYKNTRIKKLINVYPNARPLRNVCYTPRPLSASPSARKTIGVKRSYSPMSKTAASQPGKAARPPVTAARGAKKGGKLGSAAISAGRTSDDGKSPIRATVGAKRSGSHLSKPAASQPGLAARSAVVAAKPGQEGKLGDAPRRVGGTSSLKPVPVARRNADIVTKAREDLLPPSVSVPRSSGASGASAASKAPARAVRSIPPETLSSGQFRAQAPRPSIGRSRFGGERSRQRVLEPAASPGRALANPWLQRGPVAEAEEQDDRFGSSISLRASTSSCRVVPVVRRTINRSITSTYRLLPVARRAINSSISSSYRLLPVARGALNSGITSGYRLLPVARRFIARGVTSSRVRLTPMARRATSIANELIRAAGRSVRNAMTPTPRDQGPSARPLSNETLLVPHPSGASAAAETRRDIAPCRSCHRSIRHYDEASMVICDMCGSRRTRLDNPFRPRLYQCHACPADLCGLCGLPRVRHTLDADHLSPPATVPDTLQPVLPPTAPAGGTAGFGGASVAAPPSTDPSPMDVDDPTPATPATPIAIASHASAAARASAMHSTFTGLQPTAQPTFGGGAAPAAKAAATTTATTTALSATAFPAPTLMAGGAAPHGPGGVAASSVVSGPKFTFGRGGANGGNGAVTVPPVPASISASIAAASTASPMDIASPTPPAGQPTPFAFTGLQPTAQPTFGGGAVPAATVAATTTATTATALSATAIPAPTLTAGGAAPHGPGGVAASSVVPGLTFTFGRGGANGGNGAVTVPPGPAGISASIAAASTASPMDIASSTPTAGQPAPFAFTGLQPTAQPTSGGGAVPAATVAATTTATTATALSATAIPAPTLTAGGAAPHGLGGVAASSVVPGLTFTFGAGGANGGNGAVTVPPGPAGISASVAPAPPTGGTRSTQGTGAAVLPVATAPVGRAVPQGGSSDGATRRATSSGTKRRRG